MPNVKKVALVISGGGAKGAFAVGVVKYLYSQYRDTGWFSITGGTSTGALISPMAALMAAPEPMGSQVLDTLVNMYTTVSTKNILRKRGLLEWLLRRDCLNESDPLAKLVREKLRSEWFLWLQKPEAPDCYVVYVDYQNGELVKVTPKDQGMDREKFIQAMLASASIPMLMEATRVNKKVCFDGGVRDLLPFGNAIDLGADTIMPIFLDPEKFRESSDSFTGIDKILLRTFEIMIDETGRNDMKVAELINIGIRLKEKILSICKGNKPIHTQLTKLFADSKYQDLIGNEKRLITLIEKLKPDKPLAEDCLIFDPMQMKDWVAQGENKAKNIVTQSPFV